MLQRLAWALIRALIPIYRRLRNSVASIGIVRQFFYAELNIHLFRLLFVHEMMLSSTFRVNPYRAAIGRYISAGDIVLDVGTGTGILSFLAAHQKPGRIYAIDHSDMIEVARLVAEHNNIDCIAFVQTHSRSFTAEEKVDVILHEQMGEALFEQEMIANLLDLKGRVLSEAGIILPGRFEFFLEPVCLREEFRIPHIWEQNIHGVDFAFLRNASEVQGRNPVEYEVRWLEPTATEFLLCDPRPMLSFDLNDRDTEFVIPKRLTASKVIVRSGSLDGLCVYWRAIFDDEISIDTSPLKARSVWQNRMFRTEIRAYRAGDEISYALDIDNPADVYSWSVSIMEDTS